jgi:hypothetical protein
MGNPSAFDPAAAAQPGRIIQRSKVPLMGLKFFRVLRCPEARVLQRPLIVVIERLLLPDSVLRML